MDGVGMARALSRPRATESQAIDNVLEGKVVALVGDPQDGGDTGKRRGRWEGGRAARKRPSVEGMSHPVRGCRVDVCIIMHT